MNNKINKNTENKTTEKQFENVIRKYLNEKGIYHFKFWGGNLNTGDRYIKTKSGVPDLICNINGIFVGIEVKNDNGKLSDIQISNINQINFTGGLGLCCYPKDYLTLKYVIDELLKDNSKDNINRLRTIYFSTTKNIK